MHERRVEPLRRPWQDPSAGLDWSGGNRERGKRTYFEAGSCAIHRVAPCVLLSLGVIFAQGVIFKKYLTTLDHLIK